MTNSFDINNSNLISDNEKTKKQFSHLIVNTIEFGFNINKIEKNQFEESIIYNDITIPNSVTEIDEYAFKNTLIDRKFWYIENDNDMKTKTDIRRHNPMTQGGKVFVSDNISKLTDYSFANIKADKIIFSKDTKLHTIGQNAFKDAKLISKNQIYNLHFHDVWRSHNINKYINDGYSYDSVNNLIYIEENYFNTGLGDGNLNKPNYYLPLDDEAYDYYYNDTDFLNNYDHPFHTYNLIIPDSVTKLEENSFKNAIITSLFITENIKVIENNSFANVTISQLILDRVTNMDEDSFDISANAFSNSNIHKLELRKDLILNNSTSPFNDNANNKKLLFKGIENVVNLSGVSLTELIFFNNTIINDNSIKDSTIETLEFKNNVNIKKDGFTNVTMTNITFNKESFISTNAFNNNTITNITFKESPYIFNNSFSDISNCTLNFDKFIKVLTRDSNNIEFNLTDTFISFNEFNPDNETNFNISNKFTLSNRNKITTDVFDLSNQGLNYIQINAYDEAYQINNPLDLSYNSELHIPVNKPITFIDSNKIFNNNDDIFTSFSDYVKFNIMFFKDQNQQPIGKASCSLDVSSSINFTSLTNIISPNDYIMIDNIIYTVLEIDTNYESLFLSYDI